MTATTTVPPEIGAYVEAVRRALSDLPTTERDELLADVETSLLEAAADADAGSPQARLGPPEQFARELRSAAGLDAAPAPARSPSLAPAIRGWLERLLGHPFAQRARPVARELAPLWWAVRGASLAVLAALVVDGDFDLSPRSALLVAAAVVVSLWLGLAGRRTPRLGLRRVSIALSLTAVAAAPAGLGQLEEELRRDPPSVVWMSGAPTQPGLWFDGNPVQNIYPYSRDGRLLLDVQLFDGYGQPLVGPDLDPVDSTRRLVFDGAGRPILNAFPIRRFEPGTQRVARPLAAPPVKLRRIATPPLRRRGG